MIIYVTWSIAYAPDIDRTAYVNVAEEEPEVRRIPPNVCIVHFILLPNSVVGPSKLSFINMRNE